MEIIPDPVVIQYRQIVNSIEPALSRQLLKITKNEHK